MSDSTSRDIHNTPFPLEIHYTTGDNNNTESSCPVFTTNHSDYYANNTMTLDGDEWYMAGLRNDYLFNGADPAVVAASQNQNAGNFDTIMPITRQPEYLHLNDVFDGEMNNMYNHHAQEAASGGFHNINHNNSMLLFDTNDASQEKGIGLSEVSVNELRPPSRQLTMNENGLVTIGVGAAGMLTERQREKQPDRSRYSSAPVRLPGESRYPPLPTLDFETAMPEDDEVAANDQFGGQEAFPTTGFGMDNWDPYLFDLDDLEHLPAENEAGMPMPAPTAPCWCLTQGQQGGLQPAREGDLTGPTPTYSSPGSTVPTPRPRPCPFHSSSPAISPVSRRRLQTLRQRDDPSRILTATDKALLDGRKRGLSYKQIQQAYRLAEAESTLRGRYRMLTKPRAQRLRKPVWSEKDVHILKEVVAEHLATDTRSASVVAGPSANSGAVGMAAPCSSSPSSSAYMPATTTTTPATPATPTTTASSPEARLPWQRIANEMASRGAYHFGSAAVKKKWDETQKLANRRQ